MVIFFPVREVVLIGESDAAALEVLLCLVFFRSGAVVLVYSTCKCMVVRAYRLSKTKISSSCARINYSSLLRMAAGKDPRDGDSLGATTLARSLNPIEKSITVRVSTLLRLLAVLAFCCIVPRRLHLN